MECVAIGKSLLSIDWDYFIYVKNDIYFSYIENYKNMTSLWYKRYIQWKSKGCDIQDFFQLSPKIKSFWDRVKEYFIFRKDVKVFVSDSHALSYDIAKKEGCKTVYVFDAHADLGYGGLLSLDFEVNCANWLGKLLKDKYIEKAHIIYSPYTNEKQDYFETLNKTFNIKYLEFDNLDKGIEVTAIHICRSGTWTPPWFDEKFFTFVKTLGIPYQLIDCPNRKWDVDNITLSDQIYYLMI